MLLFAIYTLALVLGLFKLGFFRLNGKNSPWLFLAFLLKLGISLTLFYYPYDTLKDAFVYIQDAQLLAQVIWQDPSAYFELLFSSGRDTLDQKFLLETQFWSHETEGFLSERRNVIRLNSVLFYLSFGNTLVLILWNTVLAFAGLKLIFMASQSGREMSKPGLLFSLFFLPSILLWTSVVMKENLLVLGLGMFLYGLLSKTEFKTRIFFFLFGFVLVLMVKQYVAPAMVPAFLIWILLRRFDSKYAWILLSGFASMGLLVLVVFHSPISQQIIVKQQQFVDLAQGHLHLKDSIGNVYSTSTAVIDLFQTNNYSSPNQNERYFPITLIPLDSSNDSLQIYYAEEIRYFTIHDYRKPSGSAIKPIEIGTDWFGLIRSAHAALFNGILRPLPQDPPEGLGKWYFFVESLCLTVLVFWGFSKAGVKALLPEIAFLLTFSFGLALLIGWTIPILGALVRYKLPIVIAIIVLSWLLLGAKRQKNR